MRDSLTVGLELRLTMSESVWSRTVGEEALEVGGALPPRVAGAELEVAEARVADSVRFAADGVAAFPEAPSFVAEARVAAARSREALKALR